MMGSGKTAIGRLVAQSLKLPFIDSDQEIEVAANLQITEIFERHGEAYFRSGEERVIQRLLAKGPAVLSLGGGAFISQATRDEVLKKAVTVWLKADIDLILERVMRRPGKRPLLQTGDPRKKIAELIEQREPLYAKAPIHVPSSAASKAETRAAVIRELEAFLKRESGQEGKI